MQLAKMRGGQRMLHMDPLWGSIIPHTMNLPKRHLMPFLVNYRGFQATRDQLLKEGCHNTCRTGRPAQCHPGAAAGQQP